MGLRMNTDKLRSYYVVMCPRLAVGDTLTHTISRQPALKLTS